MPFPHIFLFTLITSKSFIDINAIAILHNQPCMNHKYMEIICKQCSTVHSLSSLHKIICKQCSMFHSIYPNLSKFNLGTLLLYRIFLSIVQVILSTV